jgi:hypothetical protein
MKNISAIRTERLHNEEHDQFMTRVRNLLNLFPSVKTVVLVIFLEFAELLVVEDRLVDAAKESAITQQLVEADRRLDRCIVGINSIVNAGLHHPHTEVAAAATRLHVRMKAFGNIESKSYEAESAAIRLLVNDLLTNFPAELEILQLGLWIEELQMAHGAFDALFNERNAEQAEKPDVKLRALRKQIDVKYREMIERINAAAILDVEGMFNEFIRLINVDIEYFNNLHRVVRVDIRSAIITPIANQTFTGQSLTPGIEVFFNGNRLILGKDFNVTYKNNVEVGEATVTIHGKGKYAGTHTTSFYIVRAI